MLPSLGISRQFLAATAFVFSATGLQPPAIANYVQAQTTSAASKGDKPANKPLPKIDFEAIYNHPQFKYMEEYILDQSVRSELSSEGLRKAAKELVTKFVQEMVNHAKPYTADDLLTIGIKGMFKSLSPHDDFFSLKEQAGFKERMSDSFVGLGIEIETKDKKIKVIAPIEGSPAEKAGFQPGDYVIEVNGKKLEGLEVEEAIKLMRGEPGSKADVKLLRDGVIIDVSLIRAEIKKKRVNYRMLEGGVAHIKIHQFTNNVSLAVKYAVAQAKADAELDPVTKAKGGLKGVVLDFMFDPGGLLPEARQISDDFIDSTGAIVTSQGRNDDNSERLTATPGDILKKLPVVVLVNEGSASASEIVAAALQDHERAIIMGGDSFGKGTVQTVRGHPDGTSTKTTIAIFRRPSGTSNQWVGVKPDIQVNALDPNYEAFIKNGVTERTLPNSIPNTRGVDSQKDKTRFVCSPARSGIKVEEAGTDKNIFVQKGDFEAHFTMKEGSDKPVRVEPFVIGALNPFVACARDYILKQSDPAYIPRFTQTVPKQKPELTN